MGAGQATDQVVGRKRMRQAMEWTRRRRHELRIPALLGGVLVMAAELSTSSSQAAPPDGATCVKAYESAQMRRKSEDFIGARQELIVCASAACPSVIQGDCIEWLGKVEDAIPLVIFEAKVNGSPVFDVSVTLAGKLLAERLDGRSVEVNPGLHAFTFERPGAPPVVEKVIIHRGAKSHTVMASWSAPIKDGTALPPPPPPPIPKTRPIPALFYALSGIGVVGLGGFAGLGISGLNQEHQLSSTCSPVCKDSDLNPVKAQYIAAYTSAGVGALSLVGAGIVLFTRPERPVKSAFDPSRFGVHPTPAGAFIDWRATF